jgi:hypothetical protein
MPGVEGSCLDWMNKQAGGCQYPILCRCFVHTGPLALLGFSLLRETAERGALGTMGLLRSVGRGLGVGIVALVELDPAAMGRQCASSCVYVPKNGDWGLNTLVSWRPTKPAAGAWIGIAHVWRVGGDGCWLGWPAQAWASGGSSARCFVGWGA